MSERIQNSTNSAIGGIKETVGNATGNSSLAAKGAAQKSQAETAQKAADAKTHAEGLGNNVQGTVQKTVGAATGNTSMEARGHANDAKGDLQRSV